MAKKSNFMKAGMDLALALGSRAAKQAAKGVMFSARVVYNHREELAGAAIGIVRGTTELAKDAYGCTICEKDFLEPFNIMKGQSVRYQTLTSPYTRGKESLRPLRETLLDSLSIGVDFIGSYAFIKEIPEDVQQAFKLAYPRLAESQSLAELLPGMDEEQLKGLAMGIKGKLFELKYADYLNSGYLPEGYSAQLARSATNPGWDIAVVDKHGDICQELQLKATESIQYIREAFARYPHIDVVTTEEVYSQLAMQGFSEHVINSGMDDQALTDIVCSSLNEAAPHFDWMPSILPFTLIAFSVSRQQELTGYQKGKQFGERASKSYAAYLAGGAVVAVTHLWWAGLIAATGSRFLFGMGRKKRERLSELKQFIATNERVLVRLKQK